MVERSFAVTEHSALVWRPVSSIYSNRNGASSQSDSQVVAIFDISISTNLEWSCGLLAGLLDSLVWVVILVNNSFVSNELEGVIHKTSVAGLVAIRSRAINQLLLREALKLSIGKFRKTLERSSSRESPARSALSLILHWSHSTLRISINVTNNSVVFIVLNVAAGFLVRDKSKVSLSELLLGKGGELVKTHFVGSVLVGVVSVDLGEVLEEDALSIGVLELRCIGDSVLGFPGLELGDLVGGLLSEEHCSSADDGEDHSELLSVHI